MPTKKQIDQSDKDALVGECIRNYSQDEKPHQAFCNKVEDWYKSYRGVLEVRSKAAAWTSKQHPPYIHQVIETKAAGLVDADPSWRVKPRPRMASPEDVQMWADGAKANELLLAQQADCDHLGEKQMLFAKQALIAGLSVYKTSWRYQEGSKRRQQVVHDPVSDQYDNVIGYQSRLGERSHPYVQYDDNTAEVVDVRDFIWHEAAISLDKAKRVTHRVLHTIEELRALEKLGVYSNVSDLEEEGETPPGYASREEELFETNRAKDMIEILEQWRKTDNGIRVTTFTRSGVLLRDKPNPFWHGQFPFAVCSAIPDLFRIPGVSDVDLMYDLQELLWTMMNQRVDNTHLLNNAIVLIREDADDYEQFEWAPGAQWIVTDPAQVSLLHPDTSTAEVSLQAETRALQDLQNITGASPALLGQLDQTTTTATEVSLTTSLGQKRLQVMKQQFKYCHARVGEQWISNNQQFVREERWVAVTGAAGAQAAEKIHPLMLQGDFYIDLEAMDQSLQRQERQAEAQARLQVMLSAAQVFAALSQVNPDLQMINPKAFMDDVLEAGQISDKERYYLPKKAQSPQLPPGQEQPQNGQGPGVTAPQATDQMAPSNDASMSPASQMQQLLAMKGGAANVPQS